LAREPATITEQISRLFEARAWRFKWATKYVKAAFITVGAFVAGIAQFAEFQGATPTAAQIVGISATVVVLLGSIFVMLLDEDASEELAAARRASEELRDMAEELDALPDYLDVIDRQISLYQAAMIMRGTVERAAISGDEALNTIQSMVVLTDRLLPVALGYAQADRWTVCVYCAEETDSGRDRLTCVAHNRAIACDISQARSWDEGVGVAGIAYANAQEIIVPNMHASDLGTIFNIAGGARDYDADVYRTMAAVPIKVDNRAKPWGVVIATNDRYGHFNLAEDVGLQSVEGIRLLAGMVALAVAVCTPSATPVQTPLTDGGGNDRNG
jgi:hypothetical protein